MALLACAAVVALVVAPGGRGDAEEPTVAAADGQTRAELDRMVTSAMAIGSDNLAAKQKQLVDAVGYYDKLSVASPASVQTFDDATLFEKAATTLVAYLKTLPPDSPQFKDAIGTLQVLMPRVRGDVRQIELYLELATLNLKSDRRSAIDTLTKIGATLVALPAGNDRDRLRAGLIRLAAGAPEIPAETVTQWAITIGHPVLRREALRVVALSRLAAGGVNKELLQIAAMPEAKGRTAALVGISKRYAGGRRFQPAFFAALAITDAHERDKTLSRLFESQLAVNFRPDAIYAPYAIADDRMRDQVFAEFSSYCMRRGRLALGRAVAGLIATPSASYTAWSAIARQQLDNRYAIPWADAWDKAADAALRIGAGDEKRGALTSLALEAASAGDEARAERVAQQVPETSLHQSIAAQLALREIDRGAVENAERRYATLTDTALRSRVAASLYRHYAGKGALDQANALTSAITEPLDQIRLAISQGEILYEDPHSPTHDMNLARERFADAESRLLLVGASAERDQVTFELAAVRARLGDVDALNGMMSSSLKLDPAVAKPLLIGALVRAGRVDDAYAQLDVDDVAGRARELGEIANAFVDRGDVMAAVNAANQIDVDRIRVRVLRAVAVGQARNQRLQAVASPPAAAPDVAEAASVVARDRFVMQPVAGATIGSALPKLPDLAATTGDTVRKLVPAVAPGQAHVIPTGFSNFNERFSYIRYMNSIDFNGDEEQVFASGQKTLFPSFIMIESGVFDLPTLKSYLEAGAGRDYITSNGRTYQLNVPLLIGHGGTLVITSADVAELRLNTAASVYLVNSGRLFVVDSKITSWDPAAGRPTQRTKGQWSTFNPFLTAWSGSETYIADATVNGLGYGNGKSYGLTISSGPKNVLLATSNALPRPRGIIVDSLFTHMYYGFYSYEATDVKVVGNNYRDNEIYAIDPHDRSTQLTFAYNSTSGTHVKHGIVTSRDVTQSYIVGNLSYDNAGSGILLDRASTGNVIAYNVSFGNKGDGLTLYESSCNLIFRNTIRGNTREGVRLRNSWDVLFSENAIEANSGTGLNAYAANLEDDPENSKRDLVEDPYHRYADFTATRNLISGNGEAAMRTAAVSVKTLVGNRLSGDASAIVKGLDLGDAGLLALSMAKSGVAIRDSCQPVRPADGCSFRDDGYLGEDTVPVLEANRGTGEASCAAKVAGN